MFDTDVLRARARFYEFFSYAFFYDEKGKGFANWQEQAKFFSQNELGCDFEPILKADFTSFKAEQNAVLFDLSYANVPLNASFYDEGRDNGKKRVEAIAVLKNSNLRRNIEKCSESEDFIGFWFLMMREFLEGQIKGQENASQNAKDTFEYLINPCIDELCELLGSHEDSCIFKALSQIISWFVNLERAYYAINAPQKAQISVAKEAMNMRPHSSKMPTAKSKLNWDEFTSL